MSKEKDERATAVAVALLEGQAKDPSKTDDVRLSAKQALEQLGATAALKRLEEAEALQAQMGMHVRNDRPHVDASGQFVVPIMTPTRARELAKKGAA